MNIFTDTPTSELLPDLKDFPDPPLDLSPDSVPIEDHTKPGESIPYYVINKRVY